MPALSRAGVCAVVVTHDRVELLRECLAAVLGQSRPPDHVLVVDNASTDATPSLLDELGDRVEVLRLERNTGGAGGFNAGVRRGVERGSDWLWLMDDDTIPRPDALERLLLALGRLDGLPDPVMLASRVLWTDGRVHPMNPPWPSRRDLDLVGAAVERSLLPIRASTFPSLLVRSDVVERHGLPRSAFFIWADDLDFSMRVLRHEPGYLVPDSVAVHKTATPHRPPQGGDRFYFAVRNGVWMLRGDALAAREKVAWAYMVAEQTREFLAIERWRPAALRTVLRGLRDGVRSGP
jgi:rhamnopyranosyl-N-acetylglucosaminyl-diphospho-decaprenol beta-1,3/1,4-galactofuranosyltransferase